MRCSQLCGLYHSFMYAPGAVVTPQQFAAWLRTQGRRRHGRPDGGGDVGSCRHGRRARRRPPAEPDAEGKGDHVTTAAAPPLLEDTPLGPRPVASTGTRTS